MTNLIWLTLAGVGFGLQVPLIIAGVQTGRNRLFPKAGIRFEQWLIDHWNLFIGMFIVGTVAFIAGMLAHGSPWWIIAAIGLIDVWLAYDWWGEKDVAQRYLNSRIPDEFGDFFCERCDKVHGRGGSPCRSRSDSSPGVR